MSQAHAAPTPAPAVAHAGGIHAVAPAHSPAEREADRFADSFVGRERTPAWSFGGVPLHADALPPPLAASLGAALGADLSAVRVHQDSEAEDLAARAGADAVTIGNDISLGQRADSRSPAGVRRIAHEVTHTVRHRDLGLAHRDGQGAVTPATTLAGLPEADRKNIQVVTTTPVNVTGLEEKFGTKGAKMTLGLPADTTVVADASAAKLDKRGLSNVAAALVTEADVSPAPLPENATVTLQLDLAAYGGIKGLYRFTYHAPAPAKGATASKRVLVEQLGAATVPAGQKPPAAPKEGEKAAPDPVADKLKSNAITHSYTGDKLEALRAAIAEIPDSHLAKVSGLRFTTATASKTDPQAAGDYSPEKHTVTMYDKAFAASQTKYEQGTVATSYTTRAIIHEIGHAIDLAPLRAAFSTYQGSGGGAAAEKKLQEARSESGSRTVKQKSGDFEDTVKSDDKSPAFRKAVAKDGKNVSKYAEKDWQESYAEAYSLYISSPDTLKLLRPATYDFLVKTMPK